MLDLFDIGRMEGICTGILTDAINSHGPITHVNKASAAKRVAGQLRSFLRQFHAQEIADASIAYEIAGLKKELKESQEKIISQGKQIRNFVAKMKENNISF